MATTAFILRVEQPETQELLRFLAARWGVSMNRLAEDMLQRELRIAALMEEGAVLRTLEMLRRFQPGDDADADAAAIAAAEAECPDQAEGRMVTGTIDPYGIAAAFAR